MANDFSGDSNCKALWRFESGALTTDSKGGNTLTDVNTVGTDTTNHMEGSACADFTASNTEYFYITNANLDSGFPLKSGDTNKKISVCFRLKVESWHISGACYMISKYNSSSKRSFSVGYSWDGISKFIVRGLIGYNNGDSAEIITHAGEIALNTEYFVCFTFQDSDKSYRIHVYNLDASTVVASDATGTTTNNINIEDAEWSIGSINFGSSLYDGLLDELVVFNDILTTDEIDQIRAGTYGAGGTTLLPIFFNHYKQLAGA